jgi:hypothetical protein
MSPSTIHVMKDMTKSPCAQRARSSHGRSV